MAWKFYFVYIVILVVECIVIYLFFPETKGYTLEEVGHLLDEDDKVRATFGKTRVMEAEVEHKEQAAEEHGGE